jgi:phenylpropionate dioxygenase-like ring-hydroxylating dioxygenase large terminal subunit
MSDFPRAVAGGWHPVAARRELRRGPLARQLMGRPLVVFESADGPAVLVDRCPHRNMALSAGRVQEGQVECPYHGWRFGADGGCTLTPGSADPARLRAEALPVVNHEGLVWTTLAKSPPPFAAAPYPIAEPGFDTFWWPVKASRARLLDAIENLLDPAHPHFLHPGIVRSGSVRRPVEVTVRVQPDRAEAAYVENARPAALMPRMLEGVRSTGLGRFFPPTIGQVAFEGPHGLRLAITVYFTPEDDQHVRPFAHFATPKGLAPAFLKEAVLRAFHVPVLAQDQAALAAQASNIERFGGPKYGLGPLDLLLPAIQALADGQAPEPYERSLTLML